MQQIANQFNTGISLGSFPESVFTSGRPRDVGFSLKRWQAVDTLVGDVLSYRTNQRCFVGFSASPDYRDLYLEPPLRWLPPVNIQRLV